MPSIRYSEETDRDLDARLREAIDNWDPRRPRRWLAKYGGWRVEKRSVLTQRYCALRDEAQALLTSA
ncbi:hypothetical protein CF104_16605 [Aeromonas jandaei]|nr:hypothetical protein CF104_16605 [Aeromonas jandaei]TNI04725.1 hypothetical protein CF135_14330 [Aeromonas veronii]